MGRPKSYSLLPVTTLLSGLYTALAVVATQESIKSASAWFLTAPHMAGGLGAQMATHAAGLADYKARLHVLYLANDILLKACATPPLHPQTFPFKKCQKQYYFLVYSTLYPVLYCL